MAAKAADHCVTERNKSMSGLDEMANTDRIAKTSATDMGESARVQKNAPAKTIAGVTVKLTAPILSD